MGRSNKSKIDCCRIKNIAAILHLSWSLFPDIRDNATTDALEAHRECWQTNVRKKEHCADIVPFVHDINYNMFKLIKHFQFQCMNKFL